MNERRYQSQERKVSVCCWPNKKIPNLFSWTLGQTHQNWSRQNWDKRLRSKFFKLGVVTHFQHHHEKLSLSLSRETSSGSSWSSVEAFKPLPIQNIYLFVDKIGVKIIVFPLPLLCRRLNSLFFRVIIFTLKKTHCPSPTKNHLSTLNLTLLA